MALEINQAMIYTVKYIDTDGIQKFKDLQAAGISDAEIKFKHELPDCQIVTIFRKS